MSGQPDEQEGGVSLALTPAQAKDLRRWLTAALGDGVSLRAEAANEGRRILALLATPSAPSGDHGGLRGAERDALDEPIYDGDLDMHQRSDAVAAIVERILKDRLAAHPVPEPAQVGEVGEAVCEAEWAFDLDFDVMCTLPPGHGGPHQAHTVGNGDIEATTTWETQ